MLDASAPDGQACRGWPLLLLSLVRADVLTGGTSGWLEGRGGGTGGNEAPPPPPPTNGNAGTGEAAPPSVADTMACARMTSRDTAALPPGVLPAPPASAPPWSSFLGRVAGARMAPISGEWPDTLKMLNMDPSVMRRGNSSVLRGQLPVSWDVEGLQRKGRDAHAPE